MISGGERTGQSALSRFFSPADLGRIAGAVREAERRTSGEIVPYVVGRSDGYEEAVWRGGLGFGLLCVAAFEAVLHFTTAWLPVDFGTMVLATCLSAGGGMLLVRTVPGLRRFFAGEALMSRRVSQRAGEAFLAEEVFHTRDRTGILIFVSLFEHKVLVVGDSGINAKVQPQEWEDVVGRVVSGIRAGRPADGLVDAIRQGGALLERMGVEVRPDDTDELPDTLRTEGS